MKVLDLFAGEGGAGEGYRRAGFDVTSVELSVKTASNNPHDVIVANAMTFVSACGGDFDLIHGSPPCQGYTTLRHRFPDKEYPMLIEPLREALLKTGKPYVIENVPGAEWALHNPKTLCGSMFGLGSNGLILKRHRLFETNWDWETPPDKCKGHKVGGVYGNMGPNRAIGRGTKFSFPEAQEAMGIDWMSIKGLSQAIPPAYTEYIGNRFKEPRCG